MTDRPSELKPCPFCGGVRVRHIGRCIECLSCGASGPEMKQEDTRQDYIRRWNTRTLDAAPADPVVSAECWRRAVLEGCAIKSFLPSAEWFEQRARELAREGK